MARHRFDCTRQYPGGRLQSLSSSPTSLILSSDCSALSFVFTTQPLKLVSVKCSVFKNGGEHTIAIQRLRFDVRRESNATHPMCRLPGQVASGRVSQWKDHCLPEMWAANQDREQCQAGQAIGGGSAHLESRRSRVCTATGFIDTNSISLDGCADGRRPQLEQLADSR